jgi:hypothetical protein
MEPINFCYWLQGYFELSDSGELTNDQKQIIARHLQLVFSHTQLVFSHTGASNSRQGQARSFMFCVGLPAQLLEQGGTAAIKDRLSSVFLHEIDKMAGGDAIQEALNAIHNPPNLTGECPLPRC